MLMQIFLFMLLVVVGYLNYYLTKTYWCHEGHGMSQSKNNKLETIK